MLQLSLFSLVLDFSRLYSSPVKLCQRRDFVSKIVRFSGGLFSVSSVSLALHWNHTCLYVFVSFWSRPPPPSNHADGALCLSTTRRQRARRSWSKPAIASTSTCTPPTSSTPALCESWFHNVHNTQQSHCSDLGQSKILKQRWLSVFWKNVISTHQSLELSLSKIHVQIICNFSADYFAFVKRMNRQTCVRWKQVLPS